MIAFWTAVATELASGHNAFVAFVATCSKGSPGTPKAQLLVRADGSQFGTIGGGIMEQRLLDKAHAILSSRSPYTPELQRLEHKPQSDDSSGLICGGGQINAMAVLGPEQLPQILQILEHLRTESGATLSLDANGFSIDETDHELIDRDLSYPFGDFWRLRISLRQHRRIVIFGAGHCGQALARQMLWLGFQVTLVDQRLRLQISQDVTEARIHQGIAPSAFVSSVRDWRATLTVVMTHSYPTDLEALVAVLPHKPRFLGLMGSPNKLKRIFSELKDHGFSSDLLRRITAPVGLGIGSDTPEEIAVSVAAQLLQLQNEVPTQPYQHVNHIYTQ